LRARQRLWRVLVRRAGQYGAWHCHSSKCDAAARRVAASKYNRALKPLFLPGIEHNPQPGPFRTLIEQMQAQGAEYPQIWHLFAFLPRATEHLARFTQEIMREPAPLSPGIRELIAAYTSRRNDCPF